MPGFDRTSLGWVPMVSGWRALGWRGGAGLSEPGDNGGRWRGGVLAGGIKDLFLFLGVQTYHA